MLHVFIDADGCAVKEETYKVAGRYQLKVFVVANKALNIPLDPNIEMVEVTKEFDSADDWIVQNIGEGDLLITSDILLAERAVKNKSRVLTAKGHEFTEDNIGDALATRELMTNLRHMGEKSGPGAMTKQDRSVFLGRMDQIIQSILRSQKTKK